MQNIIENTRESEKILQSQFQLCRNNVDRRKFILKCKKILKLFENKIKFCKKVSEKQSLESRIHRTLSLLKKSENLLRVNNDHLNVIFDESVSAFENRIKTGIITNLSFIDPEIFLNAAKIKCCNYVKENVKSMNCLKVMLNFCVKYQKEDEMDIKYFNTKYKIILTSSDLSDWYEERKEQLLTDIEEFNDKGSGWMLIEIINLTISICKCELLSASQYIDLPKKIKSKKAIVNVNTKNRNDCFAYAIMSALYPKEKNSNRMSSYPDYENILNFKDIEFPVKLKCISKFEYLNTMSINVYAFDKKQKIYPLHLTKNKKDVHVNLLFYKKEDRTHYCWIKNLSRLVRSDLTKTKNKIYICDRCLNYFTTNVILEKHYTTCKEMNKTRLTIPTDNKLEFINHKRTLAIPYVIYADFECILENVENEYLNNFEKNKIYQEHKAYSVGYYLTNYHQPQLSTYTSHFGMDSAKWFSNELLEIATQINEVKNIFSDIVK